MEGHLWEYVFSWCRQSWGGACTVLSCDLSALSLLPPHPTPASPFLLSRNSLQPLFGNCAPAPQPVEHCLLQAQPSFTSCRQQSWPLTGRLVGYLASRLILRIIWEHVHSVLALLTGPFLAAALWGRVVGAHTFLEVTVGGTQIPQLSSVGENGIAILCMWKEWDEDPKYTVVYFFCVKGNMLGHDVFHSEWWEAACVYSQPCGVELISVLL